VVQAGAGGSQAQELVLIVAGEQAQGHPAALVETAGQERLERRLSVPGALSPVVLRHGWNGYRR
jgi:hypothetical protein